MTRSRNLLLLIILLGAALRFFHAGAQSLWHDEAVSLAIADRLGWWGILTNQGQSSHPPLYYLLLKVWLRQANINDFTARIPSIVAGVLAIPLLYQAGRQLLGQRVGLWSALLMAVIPFQVYYAQEVRMYTLLAMLTTLSLLLFLRVIKHNRWQLWSGYGLCLALGLYTHYFIGFVALAYHLYLVRSWRNYRHLWRPVILLDVLLLLVFLPQVATFIQQSSHVLGGSYWLGKPNPLAFFTTIYFFILSFTLPPWLNIVGMFVTFSLLVIGLYELIIKTRSDGAGRQALILLNLGAFFPLVSVLAISQIKPVFLERTLIVCTPFLVLLLAWIISSSHRRSPEPYLAGIVGILMVVSLYRLYFDPAVQKPPLRQVAAQVNAVLQPDDVVVHTSAGSFLPFLFYQPPAEHYLLWEDPNPRKSAETYELLGGRVAPASMIAGRQRVWLVVALDHNIDYQRQQVTWFDEHSTLMDEMEIGGIFVRLYDFSHNRRAGS